jgi:hypothetical protein
MNVATETTATESLSITGRLPAACRAALIHLLAKGSVLQRNRPEHYDALRANRQVIDEILADLELTAFVDDGVGMIALRSQSAETAAPGDDLEEGEDDRPTLIRRQRLSLYQTFVVLILRRHHRDRSLAGDSKVTIEAEQIEQALVPFMPLTQSQTREDKRLNGAIALCKRHGILASVRGDERRFEILPTIRLVVHADWLESLLEKYRQLAADRAALGADHG